MNNHILFIIFIILSILFITSNSIGLYYYNKYTSTQPNTTTDTGNYGYLIFGLVISVLTTLWCIFNYIPISGTGDFANLGKSIQIKLD